MLIDNENTFCDALAVTADATATNVIDLGVGSNLFDGEPLAVVMMVDVAADSTTGDETYAFNVVTDDNASLSSSTTLVTQTIAAASLTLHSQHIIPIPVGATCERYLGFKFDVGGTTPTITVTAFLQPLSMIDKLKTYADNVTIS